jgi:Flp pilus assembly protein TadG
MRFPLTPAAARRGQVVVLVAASMIALLGMLAMSLDGGALMADRRHAQAAADAAALAAGADLYYNYWAESGWDPNHTARQAALDTAAAHGYTNDRINSKVTVNIPPASGDYAGQAGYAEVIIESYQERGFSNLFGSEKLTISTRAVAVGAPIAANVGILVLNPTAKSALNANGSGRLIVSGTPVIVDSNDPLAAIAGGGGFLRAMEFDITGGWGTTGSGGTFDGPIYTGRRPTPDPLAYLPEPDKSSMPTQSHKQVHFTSGLQILSPGLYRGGISVTSTGSLTLLPGIYYMDNGGFQFTGAGSLSALGVMIYNDPGNGNADAISVSGQGSIVMTPPATGIYSGLALFQRRDSTVPVTVSGGSGANITGTFYAAAANLTVSGGAGAANLGSQYISDTLNLQGDANMTISWNPLGVAKKRMISLVE